MEKCKKKSIAKGLAMATFGTAICLGGGLLFAGCNTTSVPGKSAYEIAVEHGFVGTEAQWLGSLKGADGMNGTNGTNGRDGVDGATIVEVEQKTIYKQGKLYDCFVLEYDDKTREPIVIEKESKKSINAILYCEDRTFEMIENGDKWPTASFYVRFDDGTEGVVDVELNSSIFVDDASRGFVMPDFTAAGRYNVSFTLGNGMYLNKNIIVYNPANTQLQTLYAHAEVKVGEGSYDDVDLTFNYESTDEDVGTFSKYSTLQEHMDLIKGGSVDFNKRGNYLITLQSGEIQNVSVVKVYDPSICNIRQIRPNGLYYVTSEPGNIDADKFFAENVVGLDLWVEYYEEYNGITYDTVKITRDMLDYSNVDFSKVGYQVFTIEYKLPIDGQVAYAENFSFSISYDLTGKTPSQTYAVDAEYFTQSFPYADDITLSIYNGLGADGKGNVATINYDGNQTQLNYKFVDFNQDGTIDGIGLYEFSVLHDYLYYSIKLKTVGTGDDAEAKLFVSDYTELQGFEQAIYNMDLSVSTVGNISAELDMTLSVYSNEGDFDDATASGEYYAVLTMSYSGIETRIGVVKIEYKKDGAYQNVIVFGETYVIDIMGNLVKKS